MAQLKLTKAAFAALYGREHVLITDETLRAQVERLAGDAFTVLLANGDGFIGLPAEDITAASLDIFGMPLGLKAILLHADNKALVAEWGGERLHAKSRQGFEIFIAPDDLADTDTSLMAFFNRLQNQQIVALAKRASGLEAQTNYLRQSAERMMLALTMSERVLQTAGYSDLALVVSIPEGERYVGPRGDIDTLEYEQIFPTDGLGLVSIELYAALPRKNPAEGYIEVSVLRDFDGKVLAFDTVPYEKLKDGWNAVRFNQMVTDVFGDVRLALRWCTNKGENAPLLAMSDISGNRFGVAADDSSLALKASKRICKPDLSDDTLQMVGAEALVGLVVLPATYPERLAFYGGDARYTAARAEQAFDPFVIDEVSGLAKVHLATDRVTGLTYRTILPTGCRHLDLEIELPEKSGPDMVVYAALAPNLDGIEAHMTRLIQGGEAGDSLIAHNMTMVNAGTSAALRLDVSACEGEVYVVMVARSDTGSIVNGWCSLNRITLNAPTSRLRPKEALDRSPRQIVRSIVLPDLGDFVQFLHGADELHRLSVEGGFMPLLLEENGGYLQTHPLKDKVSGAVLPLLVAPGTTGVVTKAATGHSHAPEFIYLVVLVRQDVTDMVDAVEAVAKAVSEGGPFGVTVEEDDGAVYWHARSLKADEEAVLNLGFNEPLSDVYSIVFVALPIDGQTSFGWCRWTSLGIIGQESYSKA